MDFTKKYILESIGFIVGTPSEFARMTEAEELFRRHQRENSGSDAVAPPVEQRDDSALGGSPANQWRIA